MTPTREQLAIELLKRIYDWDMLDSAADGPYWRREIAQVVDLFELKGGGEWQ